MKYNDARNKIKSGDLFLYQGQTFMGKTVRVFTGSSYSHVGIALWVKDRLMVLEALPPKVRLIPVSESKPEFWISVGITPTEHAITTAVDTIGLPYSYPDAVRGWLGVKPLNDLSWQCVELAQDFYKKCGLNISLVKCTPQAIVNWMLYNKHADIQLLESYE
jgi:hypothetical protein